MAKNAETMALMAMAGAWGCELVDDTNEYTAPSGFGISFIVPREATVIESASYLKGVLSSNPPFTLVSMTANWIGSTLQLNDQITFHADRPCGKFKLTSGSVFVYFCDL